MRKISANYIFPVISDPLKNGILILDDDNKILDIIDTGGKIKEIQDLEFYNGILIPGFVDAFNLLSWPDFNKEDFLATLKGAFKLKLRKRIEELQADPNLIQKGINHLEAYGTKGSADFFPIAEGFRLKQKSKVLFKNIYCNDCCIPFQDYDDFNKKTNHSPILVNRYTVSKILGLDLQSEKRFCIGTGSLGMYQKLSVFEELKLIQLHFHNLKIGEIIKWATIQPARYLGFEETLGSLEKGKSPGLNLVSNVDFKDFKLRQESTIRVLI
ncbi:amidohydrolase family protein [Ancylomarina longa]|uniref:Amidohydrolase-related domain-containing protein n=1 Tax=Ancylomarina longa TaxID=2487017 RepID=A0A434ATG3_9BACT|nr:amidohydrolase family protein [Ancylomarina longa]RUT77707.1 hypothetical protein DLK05_11605 [Ancylomarina longa]